MKIYLSGYIATKKYIDLSTIKYGLNTFPEMYKRKDLPEIISKVDDMFLDSGGFSIRIRGLKLNVRDYVKYVKQRGYKYQAIANMDTADIKKTAENQKILEGETGQKILPVFHHSDFKEGGLKLLEEYCNKYDYIALGGMAGVRQGKKAQEFFLHNCFKIAKETNTKIHGFGITDKDFLIKFPFYSVDSTTRLAGCKYMAISSFNKGNMKTLFARNLRNSLGIDLSKLPYEVRLQRCLDAWLKYNDYITKLHQAKGMEYWL